MRVVQLWRYPLKSAGGERVDELALGPAGPVGDRRWVLVEADGRPVTARRDPVLLACPARLDGRALVLATPDGTVLDSRDGPGFEAGASALLARPVRLVEADGELAGGGGHPDDPADTAVSLVSTATLGAWDVRRFRPNVLLDGSGEDGLVGTDVRLGGAVLQVRGRVARCVMVTRAQPGLAADPGVLRAVHADRGGDLAVGAVVRRPGTVRLGDDLAAGDPVPRAAPT